MGSVRKIRIVVPCYYEELRLESRYFLTALAKDQSLSFLFVNDGSIDGTLAILEAMQVEMPTQVEVMNLVRNSGKAEAVRRGMLQVLAGSFDFVGYWDADLATPLDAIENICHVFAGNDKDLVFGSRVLLLGRKIERRIVRHYLGRMFATFTSLLIGISIYDTQCGAKIFRNTPWLKQVFSKPFKVTWTFDVEILARIPIVTGVSPTDASSRWAEYPLDRWVDVGGSKVALLDFFRGGLEFGILFFYLRTPARRIYEKYLL